MTEPGTCNAVSAIPPHSGPRHPFGALNECHRDIQEKLVELSALATSLLETGGVSEAAMASAREAHLYFTTKALRHHIDEERQVFPALMHSSNERLRAAVQALRQEHVLLQRLWLQIVPCLDALARGHRWRDMAAFQRTLSAFISLYAQHMAVEDELTITDEQA